MSRFDARVAKVEAYWIEVYGKGPAGATCTALSVSVLGAFYVIALAWMVPVSVVRAFRA